MKFLVIGLGSMGKRRIRNLKHLKEDDVIGFDLREDRRKEVEEKHGIKTFDDINEAMKENPDAFIISTPPNHHLEYEMLAAKNKKHFFCEAGVFNEGIEELISLSKDIVAAPSATLRFKPSIRKIKELIKGDRIGNVVAFVYHMGQYLPDWHPWEEITDYYVGQRDTSAVREMVPFELEWLTWIFGDIKRISCMKGKFSGLKADIDDVYQMIFEFKDRILGHVLVEVVSRDPVRRIRIVGEKGTIEWSWSEDVVKLYDPEKKEWIEFKEEGFKEEGYIAKENMYIEEIRSFLAAIRREEEYPYSLEEDNKMLGLLQKAEQSEESNKHIEI